MNKSYLRRYLSGEYEEVWSELLALGSEVRQEPLYQDALAVARETMRRAKNNVEMLSSRLLELDYQFFSNDYFYEPSTQQDLLDLDQIEKLTGGALPVSIRVWFESAGSISLVGEDFKCRHIDSTERLATKKISDQARTVTNLLNPDKPLSDPFEIFPPLATLENLENRIADYQDGGVPFDFEFIISGSALSKSHMEDVHEIIIRLPNAAIDAQISGVQEWGNITFVEYLRENFRWGGFPGLINSYNRPKEILDFLTKDLLPI